MLCDRCKSKEAHVFIERTINGKQEKFALCGDCAANMDKELPFTIDLGSFFAGLSQFSDAMPAKVEKQVCSHCGMGFDYFEKNGRLGCAHCYDEFKDQLLPIIKRIHGSHQHFEDTEESEQERKEKLLVQELKQKLSEAVLAENYEEAARLRDEIKAHKEEQQ